MKSLTLSLFMLFSIVFQSFSAITESNERHQVDVSHLQTEHHHSISEHSKEPLFSDSEHNTKDCHHCGHCSGSHLSWDLDKYANLDLAFVDTQSYSILIKAPLNFSERLIRPPII